MARKKAKRKYTRRAQPINLEELRQEFPGVNFVDERNKSAFDTQEGGDHYKTMALQPLQYILTNDLPYVEGRVTEYMARWRNKGGLMDLKKARHLIDLAIEFHTMQTTVKS